jgi:hypothetical protein
MEEEDGISPWKNQDIFLYYRVCGSRFPDASFFSLSSLQLRWSSSSTALQSPGLDRFGPSTTAAHFDGFPFPFAPLLCASPSDPPPPILLLLVLLRRRPSAPSITTTPNPPPLFSSSLHSLSCPLFSSPSEPVTPLGPLRSFGLLLLTPLFGLRPQTRSDSNSFGRASFRSLLPLSRPFATSTLPRIPFVRFLPETGTPV